MTLKELRQQRSIKATRGKAATNEYNALVDKTERSAEEEAKVTALETELSALEADVAELDAKIAAREAADRRAGLFASNSAGAAARTVSEPNPETTGGFRSLAEFSVAVRSASVDHVVDQRLAALPGNSHESSGTSGEGYLIPAEFRQSIMELVFDGTDLLNMVTPEPTSSNVVRVLRDETTPWGSSGVQANWRAEGSQMTPSKLDTKGSDVRLHELYAFVVATDELISDAPRLNDRLTRQAARAIRWKASDAIMWGDGVGKPLGFMASPALVTVPKETGQAADTLVAANVANMFSRILPGNISNAAWVANPDVIPQLVTMQLGNQPIWTPPASGFQNAPGGFLFGRPIMLSEHADTLGDLGDIVLLDPDGYYAITKQGGGIDFASSIHLYFDHGAQAFRWTFRMGGQPHLSAPVTPDRSAATKSHFVALAARA